LKKAFIPVITIQNIKVYTSQPALKDLYRRSFFSESPNYVISAKKIFEHIKKNYRANVFVS